jgi:hypothetical protein
VQPPPVERVVRLGAAPVSCEVIDCVDPEIVIVTTKVFWPVPIGAGTPELPETVNCHCVPDGVRAAFEVSYIAKLPVTLSDPETNAFTGCPLIVGVTPLGMSCAAIVPLL